MTKRKVAASTVTQSDMSQVWQYVPKPVNATELFEIRDRLVKMVDNKAVADMAYTVCMRMAIDADHLGRLLDARTGTKRETMWVRVTIPAEKKSKKPAKRKRPQKGNES